MLINHAYQEALTVLPLLVTCNLALGDKGRRGSYEAEPDCCWRFLYREFRRTVTDGVDSSSLSNDKLGSGSFVRWHLFLRRVLPDSVFTIYDRGVDHISVTTKGVQEPFSSVLLLLSLLALIPLVASHGDHSRTSVILELLIDSHVHPTPSLAEEAQQRWVI